MDSKMWLLEKEVENESSYLTVILLPNRQKIALANLITSYMLPNEHHVPAELRSGNFILAPYQPYMTPSWGLVHW